MLFEGLQRNAEGGFCDPCDELDEEDASSLELWFRTMVHEAWVSYLTEPTASPYLDNQVLRLSEDAVDLHTALFEMSDDKLGKVLRPVCEDIDVLATLMQLWQPEDTLASKVETAMERLKDKRMGCFAQRLPRCQIGMGGHCRRPLW